MENSETSLSDPEQAKKGMLKIVCAWCETELGEKAGGPGISHGICPPCSEALLSQAESLKSEGDISEIEPAQTNTRRVVSFPDRDQGKKDGPQNDNLPNRPITRLSRFSMRYGRWPVNAFGPSFPSIRWTRTLK
jgi:hypothetical protein